MEYLVRVKLEDDADLGAVLETVGESISDDETDGKVLGGEFRLYEMPETDLVPDFRQRQAAAVLLMGINLPVELGDYAKQMMLASLVAPGLNTGHMPNADSNGRRAALQYARDLIDQMIADSTERS